MQCPLYYIQKGICEEECNNEVCNYDEGDCCYYGYDDSGMHTTDNTYQNMLGDGEC